jgi:hypothetical protein
MKVTKNLESTDSDHLYFNVIMNNASTSLPMLAQYSQTSTTPILNNPSEYYCSIIRFDIPVEQIPIFEFVDNTYSVTISYNGVDYQTFLIYVPNISPNIPASTSADRDVYAYQQFLDSINNALAASFALFAPAYNPATTYIIGNTISYLGDVYVSLINGNIGNTPSTSPLDWAFVVDNVAPYMSYNPITQLFTVNAPTNFYNPVFSDWNQPLKIWFNTTLWGFFHNFYKIVNGLAPQAYNTNGKNYQIIVKPTGINDITIPVDKGGAPTPGFGMSQEFISVSDWNAFLGLVFFTSNIPVKYEQIPSIQNNQTELITSSQPILTDFEAQTDGAIRNHLQYVPTAEYRLVNLQSTTELRTIDIQIYYQLKDGSLHPLYISPLDTATVKILFRKKTFKGLPNYK